MSEELSGDLQPPLAIIGDTDTLGWEGSLMQHHTCCEGPLARSAKNARRPAQHLSPSRAVTT
jgi:hypothetical protein